MIVCYGWVIIIACKENKPELILNNVSLAWSIATHRQADTVGKLKPLSLSIAYSLSHPFSLVKADGSQIRAYLTLIRRACYVLESRILDLN